MTASVYIKRGKEGSILRKHPWVFSGAIAKTSPSLQQGQVVDVVGQDGSFLGKGHYQHEGSITVRMLTLEDRPVDTAFWESAIADAMEYRRKLGFIQDVHTDAFRLVHGEGDRLPGLVVDVYHNIVVIQCHSIGMYHNRHDIANAIRKTFGRDDLSVYCKAQDTLPDLPGFVWEDGFLFGSQSEVIIKENGLSFTVNIIEGQKTGFFLDQRENRQLLRQFVTGKDVLNTFCYTGGFSVYALAAGAAKVDSVDVSGKAMILTEKNIAHHSFEGQHTGYTENVIPFLQNDALPDYDVVIVDPPAFAKSLAKRHNAVQAYKRLNVAALQKVRPGGFLFTFSCSQVVTTQLFYDTIVAAGLESGRDIRVVRHLSQGGDHPVNLFHPEGHYLKGLLVYVR